jgi:hypothetical protein
MAYLAGGRAAKAMGYTDLSATEVESLALDYVEQDGPLLQHMELPAYIYWFSRGYWVRVRLDGS